MNRSLCPLSKRSNQRVTLEYHHHQITTQTCYNDHNIFIKALIQTITSHISEKVDKTGSGSETESDPEADEMIKKIKEEQAKKETGERIKPFFFFAKYFLS
jgi:hypothetical protein